jgi:hypothetical protein
LPKVSSGAHLCSCAPSLYPSSSPRCWGPFLQSRNRLWAVRRLSQCHLANQPELVLGGGGPPKKVSVCASSPAHGQHWAGARGHSALGAGDERRPLLKGVQEARGGRRGSWALGLLGCGGRRGWGKLLHPDAKCPSWAAGASISAPGVKIHTSANGPLSQGPLPREAQGSVAFDTSLQAGGGSPLTFPADKSPSLEVAGAESPRPPPPSSPYPEIMAQSPPPPPFPPQSLLGLDHWICSRGWGWTGHSDSTSPASSSSDSSGSSCPCDSTVRGSSQPPPPPAARVPTAPRRPRRVPADGPRQSASER